MKAQLRKPNLLAERVWRVVRRIPRGRVVTYGDVAAAIVPPCSPRQVGWALRRAPAGLRLPWHRVLAAGGRIALPGESGLEQRMHLQTEGVAFRGRRVRMDLHRFSDLPDS
ncbi:MAG: methylated-DNA--[protein]-cysteine S-methyltransferase [Acidobacteria bacterium]|nr:methylated-DNA--[protein]-cysteine S-methyltransferase [Acidobacteriota bacterium]